MMPQESKPTVEPSKEDRAASTLQELLKRPEAQQACESRPESNGFKTLVGEVVDTHNPDLRGRIFVRWNTETGVRRELWLACVRGATPRKGDRVLLERPANWPELLVTAVIEGTSLGEPVPEALNGQNPKLELERNAKLLITSADGQPLVEVEASTQGPTVRLMNRDVNLEIPGKLRLRAEALELEGGRGGIDIRTEADAVVRGRFIRLN